MCLMISISILVVTEVIASFNYFNLTHENRAVSLDMEVLQTFKSVSRADDFIT